MTPPTPPDPRARLAAGLRALHDRHHLAYLKLGTEAEALTFDEVALLREIGAQAVPGGVPVVGKIGGPEARNDLYQFRARGVTGFVGPMIESAYAFKNYLQAVADVVGTGPEITVGINIETETAVRALDAMLALHESERLDFVNVGRSDLAASVGGKVDDPEVTAMTCSVLERVRGRGIDGHVGGCVTEATLAPVLARVRPDGFHTRFLAFGLEAEAPVAARVRAALLVEIDLLEVLAGADPARAAMHRSRIEVTRSRMDG